MPLSLSAAVLFGITGAAIGYAYLGIVPGLVFGLLLFAVLWGLASMLGRNASRNRKTLQFAAAWIVSVASAILLFRPPDHFSLLRSTTGLAREDVSDVQVSWRRGIDDVLSMRFKIGAEGRKTLKSHLAGREGTGQLTAGELCRFDPSKTPTWWLPDETRREITWSVTSAADSHWVLVWLQDDDVVYCVILSH